MPDTLVVYVDPDIEDLVPDFLANRRRDVGKLEAAAGSGDFETLRSVGHTLKGVGGGFGFDGISEIGHGIETAARAGNLDEVRQGVAALRSYLDRVEVVIDAET